MAGWSTAPAKAEVRSWQLLAPPARHALFLPGWDAHARRAGACVREGLRTGLVGPGTRVVAVERDAGLASLVGRDLAGLGLGGRLRMHADDLSRLRLDPSDPLDFAFVDLLGNLDGATAAWMRDDLSPALAPGATLSLTFAYGFRANRFLARCRAAFEGPYAAHARAAAAHFRINDPLALVGLLIVMSALPGRTFSLAGAVHYQDNVRSMVAYRLDGVSEAGETMPWPDLSAIAGDEVPRSRASSGKDKASGRMAVAAHIRRIPPRVGRVDPDEGLPADARSQAALKAWATRRARGWVHPRSRERGT